jgi:DNA-directed RNA polymerase specialized sigma24 family protein
MAEPAPSIIPTVAAYQSQGVELAETYFRNPANNDARENLAAYCLQRITIIVRGLVYGRGLYFRSCGPDIFFDECVSKASEKYALGIDSLEHPKKLHAWLKRMVRCVLIDLFWEMRGQQEEERQFVPVEKKDKEGEQVIVLDQEETRAAALPHLPASTLLTIDAEVLEKLFGNWEFLKKVLEKHAEDNPDSAVCVQKTWEDVKVRSIAQERGCSDRTVYRLLRHDNREIVRIGREMIGKEMPVEASRPPATSDFV